MLCCTGLRWPGRLLFIHSKLRTENSSKWSNKSKFGKVIYAILEMQKMHGSIPVRRILPGALFG